jgi:AraC-like DNA-binding protein
MEPFIKYITPDPDHLRWGISMITCGYNVFSKDQDYPDNSRHPAGYHLNWQKGRVLDGYYLVYITKGTGVFESENHPLKNAEAGNLFLLYPGVWHRYKPSRETGWEEYWVGFKGPFADNLMNAGFFTHLLPVVQIGHHELLHKTFVDLFDTARDSRIGYQFILSGIVLKILGICYSRKNYMVNDDNFVEGIIEKAKFILQENAQKTIMIESVATDLQVSYSWFRKMFKAHTGVSPARYHNELRITRAKELLSHSSISVKRLADLLDFENVYYFSKIFKKHTGVSPSAFRSKREGA